MTSDSRRTVLCVTGDAEAAALFQPLLAEYELVVVSTARDGLRAVNARPFDAYLLDYYLPDWTGVGLCREIKALDPNAPVLFCTGAARDADRARALRAGASAYLLKPVEPAKLKSSLRALITLAERESLHAKLAEEAAVQDELARRLEQCREQLAAADRLLAASVERTARNKALKAFFAGRGTRAQFERAWPEVFSSGWENYSHPSSGAVAEPPNAGLAAPPGHGHGA
jgi:putative two-component system response regulator